MRRDFPWTVPVGHLVLMVVPGVVVAGVNRFWPALLSLRVGSWLFATLAIWSALLRMPLYGACNLLLAAGFGRVIGDAVAAHVLRPRQTQSIFAALASVLGVLAVLSSGWQAVREYPVSLRDLPATVVDLLGMSADSPFPGHSLAACWKLPSGAVPPEVTSPAFSEQADATAFQIQPGRGREHHGFQMSIVALGRHYVRDGMGVERLYDLRADPLEGNNLTRSTSGNDELAVFRRMLLEVLTENPGSDEVEKAYMANYRRWLEDLVRGNSSQSVAVGD